jgi:hypothetical protein
MRSTGVVNGFVSPGRPRIRQNLSVMRGSPGRHETVKIGVHAMRRYFAMMVMSAGLVLGAGCCHTCDVCDDCGGCDTHYGVYGGGQECTSCGTHASKVTTSPTRAKLASTPVHSTYKTR